MVQRGTLTHHKVRHLTALSVRNLQVSPGSRQSAVETNDDDSLPNAFASPSKLLSKRASLSAEHSRSATNLDKVGKDAVANGSAIQANGHAGARPGKIRRRSTINWLNESPVARQKRLEDVVKEHMHDVWVSLHESASAAPFMITEVMKKTMNADFMSFKVPDTDKVSRSESFTLKLWVEGSEIVDMTCVLELGVHMDGLEYVGKVLEDLAVPLTENTVIFHLTDGIYIDPASRASFEPSTFMQPVSRAPTIGPAPTSSFDALMKIRNLIECIDDALSTRNTLSHQIESFINEQSEAESTVAAAASARASQTATREALSSAQREISKLRAHMQQTRSSLESRRAALSSGLAQIHSSQPQIGSIHSSTSHLRTSIAANKAPLSGQIRRIAQQLLTIFPVEPIPHAPLCFTIAGLYLPNASQFESSSTHPTSAPTPSEDTTAAALGHVALAVTLLASKLAIALPYTISYRGSASSVFDPLTAAAEFGLGSSAQHSAKAAGVTPTPENSPWRVFVLSQKAAPSQKFNWGVYLVNKCLEEVSAKVGIRVVDPRNTLPNLKVLLEGLANGRGEAPGRKVGVIRALSGLNVGG